MRRLAFVLLVFYAFAVPWQYALNLGEPFGNVARIAGVLLLAAAIPAALSRRVWHTPGAMQILVLMLFLYLAVTFFWSIDPQTTLEKIRAYFQVMMVAWIAWEFVETPAQFRTLLYALVLGSCVLSLLTLSGFFSASTAAAAQQARFTASGQDPNDVARFLDLVFPLAALLITQTTRLSLRLLALAYIPLGILAVILTASRGGFLGILVALGFVALVLLRWRPAAALPSVILSLFLGTVAWAIIPAETFARLATIPAEFASLDFNDRFTIWTSGLHAFAHAPWFGYGAGNYSLASGLATEDTAHNTLMALLVMGGLVAASLLVAILLAALRSVLHASGLPRLAFLGVFLVWCVTASVGSVEENRMTWLIFACFALAGRFFAAPPRAHAASPASAPCPSLAPSSPESA